MEEKNDVFFAGGDALVCLAKPTHKKYSATFFKVIYLVRTYLMTNFLTPPTRLPATSLPPTTCSHMYAFRVTRVLRMWFHRFDTFLSNFDFARFP